MVFKTLYHESMKPVTPASEQEQARFVAMGYQEQYVHQNFPKHIYHPDLGIEPNGTHRSVLVETQEEHDKAMTDLGPDARYNPADFGKPMPDRTPPSVRAAKLQASHDELADENADLKRQLAELQAKQKPAKQTGDGK